MSSKRSLSSEGSPGLASKRPRVGSMQHSFQPNLATGSAADVESEEDFQALESSAPTHRHIGRCGLQRAIALMLRHSGFSSATTEAMGSFASLVETYLASIIQEIKRSALASRREHPIPIDFESMLRYHNLHTSTFRPHLKTPMTKSQLKPSYYNLAGADADPPRSLPLLSQELSGQADKDSKPFIPSSFPSFPSLHTYRYTPQQQTSTRDSRKVREEAARTAQQGEDALRRLVRASKMRKQKEVKSLVERDSQGKERFRLWEVTMRRFMAADGRGDEVTQAEIADHSMIINGEVKFARKEMSRLGKRSTAMPAHGI